MLQGLASFATFLSILWFLVYWILGGVFFSVVALTRWGRLHRVTFSCLFTLLSLACGIGAAWGGLRVAEREIDACLAQATTRAEAITAIFGCGFVGIFSVFMIGAGVLVVGGFLFMALASSKTEPWVRAEDEEEAPTPAPVVHDNIHHS